jgi:hypothetical protein
VDSQFDPRFAVAIVNLKHSSAERLAILNALLCVPQTPSVRATGCEQHHSERLSWLDLFGDVTLATRTAC